MRFPRWAAGFEAGDEEREDRGLVGDGRGLEGRFLSGLVESEMLLRPLRGASGKA